MNYLTLKQTAEKFGVSTKTIQRLVKNRRIPCTHATGTVRFPEATLDDWARAPELVSARWFSGKLGDDEREDDGDTKRENLGRSLFLQGQQGE